MTAVNDETGSEHVYDWWSRHPRALDLLYDAAFFGRDRAFRQRAIETLNLIPGENVFEVGCGTGNSFIALREAVGPNGTIVGLDTRLLQQWPWRLANPIIVSVAERATNWVPQVDLLAILRREFEAVDVATFNAGSIFIACAQTKYT